MSQGNPVLEGVTGALSRVLRYDPGGLRLVRGLHLTLAVVVSALLAVRIGSLADGEPGFTLAVVCAAAAAHVLLFTPVSTRRREAARISKLSAVLVAQAAVGALVGTLAGASAPTVLQAAWIGVIAVGFSLDGLGPFWMRAGRMISIFWLFVIMSSTPQSAGVWLPAMTLLGTAIAFIVRLGLWRPSAGRTFERVEQTNRKAMADYLELAANGRITGDRSGRVTLHDLAVLRAELEFCADLAGADAELRGISPESAAMMRLALEVVRDAIAALPEDARADLIAHPDYQNALRALLRRVGTGTGQNDAGEPDLGWARGERRLRKEDEFQVLRIAQAFYRLWQLSDAGAVIDTDEDGSQKETVAGGLWQRLSWRLALQASVAAAVGYAIGSYFQLSHAYWITITVIVVLCSSLGATVQKTVQRTVGTAVGFVFAIALQPVLSDFPDIRLVLIVALLPAIIILFERNYGIAVGFISFLVLIGLEALTGLPVSGFWERLYDTLIGAGVGLAAAWLLFPKRSGKSLRSLAGTYLASCEDFLKTGSVSGDRDKEDYTRLKKEALALVAAAKAYRSEQVPWSSFVHATGDLDVLIIVLADYVVLYRQARTAVRREVAGGVSGKDFEDLLARMDKRVLDEFESLLKNGSHPQAPGLAEAWLAAMPQPQKADIRMMTDWVATLYYARKVVRCLEGLHQEHIWSSASDLQPGTRAA